MVTELLWGIQSPSALLTSLPEQLPLHVTPGNLALQQMGEVHHQRETILDSMYVIYPRFTLYQPLAAGHSFVWCLDLSWLGAKASYKLCPVLIPWPTILRSLGFPSSPVISCILSTILPLFLPYMLPLPILIWYYTTIYTCPHNFDLGDKHSQGFHL